MIISSSYLKPHEAVYLFLYALLPPQDANANAKQRVEKDRHLGSGGAQPAGGGRGRHWRPSLQSISEAAAGQSSSSISESTAS